MALKSFQDQLLTAAEVAEYLGLATKTMYNMRLRGEGPRAFKLGKDKGVLRYRKQDVDAWLHAHRDEEASG